MAAMPQPDLAHVWVWLPGSTSPTAAGQIRRTGAGHQFAYDPGYLANPAAISLYSPELPLRPGWAGPPPGLTIAGCLADASPDAWGQHVITAYRTRSTGTTGDPADLETLDFLLATGSNRIGALDFQTSGTDYVPRNSTASLDELHAAADALQTGELRGTMPRSLVHAAAAGGARPKVLLTEDDVELIAKLPTRNDRYPVVKAEAAGLALARLAGIDVPNFELVTSSGRDVLLVERFDRPGAGRRRMLVSALTMLALDGFLGARHASYPELLDVLRTFTPPGTDPGREMFQRICFNVAIGNTDDHAHNHAAFWDGHHLRLTPAYDLCPQPRSGTEANQAMAISRSGARAATFATCVDAAADYGLTRAQARDIVDQLVTSIEATWDDAADAAKLSTSERAALRGRQILNPHTFS